MTVEQWAAQEGDVGRLKVECPRCTHSVDSAGDERALYEYSSSRNTATRNTCTCKTIETQAPLTAACWLKQVDDFACVLVHKGKRKPKT